MRDPNELVRNQRQTTQANPDTDASALGASSVLYVKPDVDTHEEEYPFLSPAQRSDELGRLGGYRIVRVLGRGGMGIVFEAEDPRLRRRIAIKVMLPELAKEVEYRQRFLREARATAAIEHDNILPILRVGEENGVPFIAMPFLKGESLDVRQKRAPLSFQEIVAVGRQIAEGLFAAHQHGLVHRDIKPANIWLEPRGEDNGIRVRILDFGLVRPVGDQDRLTQSGTVLGTPTYMAPEQASGKPLDNRADLFSLGVVLYELSTGRLPFSGKNTYEVLCSLVNDTPVAPINLNPRVPAQLSQLILKLLEKDRDSRPSSGSIAAELLKQTMIAISGEPPAAMGRQLKKGASDLQGLERQRQASPPPTRKMRAMLIWLALGVGLLVGGGYAGYTYLLEHGPGSIEISVAENAVVAYGESNGLSIYDATGKTHEKLISSERRLRMPPGVYTAKVEGSNLEIETADIGNGAGSKKTLEFKIEPLKTRRLKIVLVGQPPKKE